MHDNHLEKLFLDRKLPAPLLEAFLRAGIQDSEIRKFTHELFALGPTPAELEEVTKAKNPWEYLEKLRKRANSEDRKRERAQAIKRVDRLLSVERGAESELGIRELPQGRVLTGRDTPNSRSPQRVLAQSADDRSARKLQKEVQQRESPRPTSENPFVCRLEQLSEQEVREYYSRFCKAHNLDAPGVIPERALNQNNLLIFQALKICMAKIDSEDPKSHV